MNVSSISQVQNQKTSNANSKQEAHNNKVSFSSLIQLQNNKVTQNLSTALLPFINYELAPINFIGTSSTSLSNVAETILSNENHSVTKPTAYETIIKKSSDTYNISENLIKAIIKTESNFSNDTVSIAGAQGLMQLMPGTASYLGVTDPFNPEENINGGTAYIRKMLDKYNNDITLALAAYNAGPGNVDKYGGIPPFKETQNYVKKVLTAYNNFEQV